MATTRRISAFSTLASGLALAALIGALAGCDDDASRAAVLVFRGSVVLSDHRSPGGARVTLDNGETQVVGADGRFAFVGVSPGPRTVTATLEGYQSVAMTRHFPSADNDVRLLLEPVLRNRAPVLTALGAEPTAVSPGGVTVLSAAAQDPDGDDLDYEWSAPAGWTLESTGPVASVRAPELFGVQARVAVSVHDGRGGRAVADVLVATLGNHAPTLRSVSASPPQTAPGGTIALAAAATDPEGQPLTYQWTAPGDWSLAVDPNDSARATLTAPVASGVSATISVSASDGSAQSAAAQLVVSTTENHGPTVRGIAVSQSPIPRGGTIRLAATADDPDGDALTYTWSVLGSGWTLLPAGTEAGLVAPNTPSSIATVTVVVSDGLHDASASTVVATAANEGPLITSLVASPNPVSPGALVALSVAANDAEGDALSYAWRVSGATGWTLTPAGAAASLRAPNLRSSSVTVLLDVSDPHGGVASRQLTVSTTSNSAPAVSALVANPNPVDRGGVTVLSASAFDADGDLLTYRWSAPTGSGWSIVPAGSSAALTAPNASLASTTVTLTVSDGAGGETVREILVSTRANAAPQIASLVASPNPVARGGTVSVSVSAADPDGDTLGYSWAVSDPAWTMNGDGSVVTVRAPAQPSAVATVTVTASDGAGGTASREIALSTLPNAPPTIASLGASPNPVARAGEIALSAVASDPDGDPLSYAWGVAGEGWTLSGSGAAVTLLAPNRSSSSAIVTLTVADANGGEVAKQVAVSTQPNTAPVIASLGATPNPVARSGDVTVVASASDAEGDALTYAWSLDPANGWTLTGTGSSITATAPAAPAAAATVRLVVTDAGGAAASAQAVLSTQANIAPRLFLGELAAQPVHGRTFTHLVRAEDADGDPLTFGLIDAPAGVTIDPAGGVLSWLPGQGDVGPFSFFVTVSDGFEQTAALLSGIVGELQFRERVQPRALPDRYPDGEPAHWETSVIADLDGDGRADLAAADRYGNVAVALGIADGIGLPRLFFESRTELDQCGAMAAAKLDADDSVDLVIACGSGQPRLVVWLNDGSGAFTRVSPVTFPQESQSPRDIDFVDFNGDLRPDVVVVESQQLLVWQNQGSGSFSPAFSIQHDASCTAGDPPAGCGSPSSMSCFRDLHRVVIANFDGDPAPEALVVRGRSETFFCPSFFSVRSSEALVYDLSGTGELSLAATVAIGPDSVQEVKAADLDGDGDTDVVALGQEQLWVGGNSAGSLSFSAAGAVRLSEAGAMVVADVDRDGVPDVLYPSPRSSGFQLHLGDGQLGFASAIERGASSDLPFCEFSAFGVGQWDLDRAGDPDVLRFAQGCIQEFGGGEFDEVSSVVFISF